MVGEDLDRIEKLLKDLERQIREIKAQLPLHPLPPQNHIYYTVAATRSSVKEEIKKECPEICREE